MMKTYILDTNVLLHDPKSLFAFENNEVVIPLIVLDELDKKKEGLGEIARNAREVIRTLDDLRAGGNISVGIKTKEDGLIRVELSQPQVPGGLDADRPDNKIISVALKLKSDQKTIKVVSKDINLRVKCDALDIKSEDYNSDYIADNVDELYSGCSEFDITSEELDNFQSNGFLSAEERGLFENQYIQLKSNGKSALSRFTNGKLVKINYYKDIWGINPRNKEQTYALDALFNPDIKLVTLTGRSGSGKTLLSIAAGIYQLLDSHVYKRIIVSKPTVSLGKNHDIGFLPGSLEEKMAPHIAPIMDNLSYIFSDKGDIMIEQLKEEGKLQVEALSYIRGRSIPKTFILIDECQNLTRHEIKTILTRCGEDSKAVIIGDINQIDTLNLNFSNNGLSYVIEKFKTYSISAHISLKKGERSELASLASNIL